MVFLPSFRTQREGPGGKGGDATRHDNCSVNTKAELLEGNISSGIKEQTESGVIYYRKVEERKIMKVKKEGWLFNASVNNEKMSRKWKGNV